MDKKGLSKHKEYKAADPNAPVIQLNCITPPSDIFESTGTIYFLKYSPKKISWNFPILEKNIFYASLIFSHGW